MLKIFKKKKFWIILVVALVIIGLISYGLLNKKPTVSYTTEAVKYGNLVQTVSATGMVESAHEIILNFKIPGKITSLPFKEGSEVKAGNVLATIDSSSINAQIKQYQANVAAAQANLDKVKAGASAEDVNLTQEQLAKAQNDYNNLLRESENQIKTLREKTMDSLNNSIFTAQTTLNIIFDNLLDTETTVGLIVNNSAFQAQVTSDYLSLKNKFSDVRLAVEAAKTNADDQIKVISASDTLRNYLTKLSVLLDDAYVMASKIIVNTTYTQTSVDSMKSNIDTQQTANNTALTALQTARSNLINNINSYQSQILAASNTVAINQAQLDLKQAEPRSFDVEAAEAQVAQAQATLDKARADAQDYVIRAPIDGKITKVNYSVGETSNTSLEVIDMLGNERYEVKVDIPESDITKIQISDKVTIELDAFGSDHPFSGIVTAIDPAQTVIKDVIYYKITVSFNSDSWSDQIKPGMTANITALTAEKNNALYVPQRAVKVRETALGETPDKYVQILVNGQPQEKKVEICLRGDNGLVEIISGLSEGDSVITFMQNQ